MNLSELRTFLTIVETGSLIRTSERLNVTQSTVTARLKTLEDEVGQILINRNKSGATMTAAGVKLHRYAETISDLWRQARQETALPVGTSGVCNLACEFDLWDGLGKPFFHRLQDQHPDVAITVWLGNGTDVVNWLATGKSDLAFTYQSAVTQRQALIPLPADQLVLVSTQSDSPIRFDPNYVFVEAGGDFGRDHAVTYANAGTARISFGNASTGLDYLLKAGGSAYLPLRLVQDALDNATLFRLTEAQDFSRPVFLTYNKSARTTWPWFSEMTAGMSA